MNNFFRKFWINFNIIFFSSHLLKISSLLISRISGFVSDLWGFGFGEFNGEYEHELAGDDSLEKSPLFFRDEEFELLLENSWLLLARFFFALLKSSSKVSNSAKSLELIELTLKLSGYSSLSNSFLRMFRKFSGFMISNCLNSFRKDFSSTSRLIDERRSLESWFWLLADEIDDVDDVEFSLENVLFGSIDREFLLWIVNSSWSYKKKHLKTKHANILSYN